jgi:hypothetical protein
MDEGAWVGSRGLLFIKKIIYSIIITLLLKLLLYYLNLKI